MAKTVRMVATAEHQYYGRRILKDTEYDCEEQHVETMVKQGWARPKADSPSNDQARGQEYLTRDMVAGGPRGGRRSRT